MTEIAVLAGGCFWGVEEIFRQTPGVLQTQVGYTGGHTSNPQYEQVKTGTTGHAEAIKISFDSTVTNFKEILRLFFRLHDPTTENRQGNDRGSQYRSAIFCSNDAQQQQAKEIIAEVATWKLWNDPIVTEVCQLDTFYPAEDWHQRYLEKNPGGYSCHFIRPID